MLPSQGRGRGFEPRSPLQVGSMSQRLENEYNKIYNEGITRFLQNDLVLDINWGKSVFGVTLQINLPENVKGILCKHQKNLLELEPNRFLTIPREYQHISFNQVIHWNQTYKQEKGKVWETIAEEFVENFMNLDNKLPKFQISFRKLIATTSGIIWCAFDKNDEMQSLRKYLLEKLPFPSETVKFNQIIHTTVARYRSKLSNPQRVIDYLGSIEGVIPMNIDEITLKKELEFPSLKTEKIAGINLINPKNGSKIL